MSTEIIEEENPDDFIKLIDKQDQKNLDFKCILLGKNKQKKSGYFDQFVNRFSHRILHAGYCETFEEYASLLWQAKITSSKVSHAPFEETST